MKNHLFPWSLGKRKHILLKKIQHTVIACSLLMKELNNSNITNPISFLLARDPKEANLAIANASSFFLIIQQFVLANLLNKTLLFIIGRYFCLSKYFQTLFFCFLILQNIKKEKKASRKMRPR